MSFKRSNEALSYYDEGIRCLRIGQFAEAVIQLKLSTYLDNENPDALVALCLAAHEVELDDPLFHMSLSRLLVLPDGPALPLGIAIQDYRRGFYTDAIAYASRSLNRYSRSSLSLYVLGRAYLAEQMFEESKSSFRRALELDPDFAVVQKLYRWLLTYLSFPENERHQTLEIPGTPMHCYPLTRHAPGSVMRSLR